MPILSQSLGVSAVPAQPDSCPDIQRKRTKRSFGKNNFQTSDPPLYTAVNFIQNNIRGDVLFGIFHTFMLFIMSDLYALNALNVPNVIHFVPKRNLRIVF
jgi:hypothetical protein